MESKKGLGNSSSGLGKKVRKDKGVCVVRDLSSCFFDVFFALQVDMSQLVLTRMTIVEFEFSLIEKTMKKQCIAVFVDRDQIHILDQIICIKYMSLSWYF